MVRAIYAFVNPFGGRRGFIIECTISKPSFAFDENNYVNASFDHFAIKIDVRTSN